LFSRFFPAHEIDQAGGFQVGLIYKIFDVNKINRICRKYGMKKAIGNSEFFSDRLCPECAQNCAQIVPVKVKNYQIKPNETKSCF
jgi:hypothetical protein